VVTKNEFTKPTFSPKTSEQIVVTFVGTQAWSHQDHGEPAAAYAKGSSQLRWLPEGYVSAATIVVQEPMKRAPAAYFAVFRKVQHPTSLAFLWHQQIFPKSFPFSIVAI
jgi:hypothetical protein